jgi:hypothetical protein
VGEINSSLTVGVDEQIVVIGNKSPTFTIRRWYDGKPMATQRLMDMGSASNYRANVQRGTSVIGAIITMSS